MQMHHNMTSKYARTRHTRCGIGDVVRLTCRYLYTGITLYLSTTGLQQHIHCCGIKLWWHLNRWGGSECSLRAHTVYY